MKRVEFVSDDRKMGKIEGTERKIKRDLLSPPRN